MSNGAGEVHYPNGIISDFTRGKAYLSIQIRQTYWARRVAWSILVALGAIDSSSNLGGPTLNPLGIEIGLTFFEMYDPCERASASELHDLEGSGFSGPFYQKGPFKAGRAHSQPLGDLDRSEII